ncbi:MAG: hypothetical protein IKK96_02800 [Lachnospiraceae bacterium]|nr:hypothetical protein [Lachnospiraceae bacterium]
MINFDEEIKKFHPSPEVEETEAIINGDNLTDMVDIMLELLKEKDKDKED